ncbi:MAG TPA: cyclomaltodextrinase N-terminal domain-containing protein, partial [Pyrinomonadaceae bacterium]
MNATKKHRKHKRFALKYLCFFAALFCSTTYAQTPSVTKVDPPSWWPKHTINPVRLLVRGANLRGAKVTSLNPELRASNVSVNERGTYLFVDVEIGRSLRPGTYPLVIETPTGSTTIPFTLEPPLDTRANFQGVTTDDVIYLIMTDRFADGDPSNNA